MLNSMYIDVLDKFMTIKCRHPECFGKTYPCSHILMNKNEMNIAFNGDVTININNTQDDELIEFQQIDIFDDSKLNELVYNSLNGEPYPCAEIMYYYYKDLFIYGEDENWYIYENHKWKCIGKKNMELRDLSQKKLKELSEQAWKYAGDYNYAAADTGVEFNDILEQKFAELIIKECINYINDRTEDWDAELLWIFNDESGYMKVNIDSLLKEHFFGVKE